MAMSPFYYDDFCRPSRLIDQRFGLALTPDDLMLPTFNSMANYYRPWRNQLEDTGSTIANDKEKFRVCLDVQQFRPDEITVKTTAKQIIIEGKHEERQDEHGYIARQFTRKYSLPEDCDSEDVRSSLTADGVLTIEARKRITNSLKDKERIVNIDRIAAVCQKSGGCKKDTAQNIKESMQNKIKEESRDSLCMNSKQMMDQASKEMMQNKTKDESMCAMNSKKADTMKDDFMMSSLKSDCMKEDFMITSQISDSLKDSYKMKASAGKEERCSLLNADGTLKFSSESSAEAKRTAKASSIEERLDFSSTSVSSEMKQSKESSFSSTEVSSGFRSGEAVKKGDLISEIIIAELKQAADHM